MIDVASLSPTAQAGALIGAVLVEAMVLYVGYGALQRVVGRQMIERIQDY